MTYLATLDLPLESLTTYPGNPRRGNLAVVEESLRRNDQYRAIVVQAVDPTNPAAGGTILAGNHTFLAASKIGMATIRAELHHVDDETAKRIVAVDNRSADIGEYDDRLLVELLSELDDLAGTGYDNDDLDQLVASLEDPVTVLPPEDPEPATPSAPPAEPVTKPGDVWHLGPHRLVCGDARDHGAMVALLDGQQINLAVTSPPYASQRKYDPSSGFQPVPPAEYVEWFEDVQANVRAHLAPDGSWFVNIRAHAEKGQRSLYVYDLVAAHVRQWGWRFVDDFCWVDTHNGVPGAWPNRFKDAWEPVFHFSLQGDIKFYPSANATDTERAFGYDSSRESSTGSGLLTGSSTDERRGLALPSNVLHLAAASGEAGGLHSAPFPVTLPAWFIRAYSDTGDIVFDPFMGSGTTLIAADIEERMAYGLEISAGYCDVICRRYQRHTGEMPTRDGKSHNFLSGA